MMISQSQAHILPHHLVDMLYERTCVCVCARVCIQVHMSIIAHISHLMLITKCENYQQEAVQRATEMRFKHTLTHTHTHNYHTCIPSYEQNSQIPVPLYKHNKFPAPYAVSFRT